MSALVPHTKVGMRVCARVRVWLCPFSQVLLDFGVFLCELQGLHVLLADVLRRTQAILCASGMQCVGVRARSHARTRVAVESARQQEGARALVIVSRAPEGTGRTAEEWAGHSQPAFWLSIQRRSSADRLPRRSRASCRTTHTVCCRHGLGAHRRTPNPFRRPARRTAARINSLTVRTLPAAVHPSPAAAAARRGTAEAALLGSTLARPSHSRSSLRMRRGAREAGAASFTLPWKRRHCVAASGRFGGMSSSEGRMPASFVRMLVRGFPSSVRVWCPKAVLTRRQPGMASRTLHTGALTRSRAGNRGRAEAAGWRPRAGGGQIRSRAQPHAVHQWAADDDCSSILLQ